MLQDEQYCGTVSNKLTMECIPHFTSILSCCCEKHVRVVCVTYAVAISQTSTGWRTLELPVNV